MKRRFRRLVDSLLAYLYRRGIAAGVYRGTPCPDPRDSRDAITPQAIGFLHSWGSHYDADGRVYREAMVELAEIDQTGRPARIGVMRSFRIRFIPCLAQGAPVAVHRRDDGLAVLEPYDGPL